MHGSQDAKNVAATVGKEGKKLASNLADTGDEVAADVKDNAEPTAAQVTHCCTLCTFASLLRNVDRNNQVHFVILQVAMNFRGPLRW